MGKKSKNVILIINVIIFFIMIIQMILCLRKLEWYIQVFSYICISLFSIGTIVFAMLNKESLMKSCFTLNILVFSIILIFTVFNLLGIFESFSDIEKIKKLILDSGTWGYIIFAFLQVLNIVILPIPAFILHLAGVSIFGAWTAFIISYISVLIGSFIAFFLGRIFGKKVVIWCIGEELTEKYSKMLGTRGYFPFIIMQILPFFPDDILCMIAGMTSMSLTLFSLAMILVRPIYIGIVCFLGTGSIIPFSGWGIPVWILIFVIFAILCILFSVKYKKIEKWLNSLTQKNNSNSEKSQNN